MFLLKIDLHTHCLPVSLCAEHQAEELPGYFRQAGVDAVVLTNHCYPSHCDPLSPDPKEQARIYLDTYHRCKARGELVGLKVLFGAEIKLINESHCPEFLLYGLSEQDFLDSYPLYACTQRQLFEFCNQKDILMVQAHPYRREQGYEPADMRYVHGIEVYNSHIYFDPKFEETLTLAKENGKLMTSGTDFHVKEEAGLGGLILPDDIEDQFMLRDYLRQEKTVIFNKDGVFYECDNTYKKED